MAKDTDTVCRFSWISSGRLPGDESGDAALDRLWASPQFGPYRDAWAYDRTNHGNSAWAASIAHRCRSRGRGRTMFDLSTTAQLPGRRVRRKAERRRTRCEILDYA